MRVAVVTDLHFYRDSRCDSYTPVMYGYEFFKRYHNVFEEVVVVARGNNVCETPTNMLKINGEGVETFLLPETLGIIEYGKKYFALRKKMEEIFLSCDTAIIRIPSALSSLAVSIIKRLNRPFALEMVVDPYSVKPGKDIKSRIISKYVVDNCKKACLEANGVSYVTKEFLQKICPCQAIVRGKESREYFTAHYSSVTLPENYFAQEPKYYHEKNQFVICHTANLIQNETKGHRVVIDIVKKLREKGINISAVFVGDGKAVEEFKQYARGLDIEEHIQFVGKYADPFLVRQQLINSDFYIFPSEAEGLPRGLIEAMACGLVCIASNVSGIPELLDQRNMFDPKDVDKYVSRIEELLNNPHEMEIESSRNIRISREYSTTKLTLNRNKFYNKLKAIC